MLHIDIFLYFFVFSFIAMMCDFNRTQTIILCKKKKWLIFNDINNFLS